MEKGKEARRINTAWNVNDFQGENDEPWTLNSWKTCCLNGRFNSLRGCLFAELGFRFRNGVTDWKLLPGIGDFRLLVTGYRFPTGNPLCIYAPWNQEIAKKYQPWTCEATLLSPILESERVYIQLLIKTSTKEDFRGLYVFSLLFCCLVKKLKTASSLPALFFTLSIKHESMTIELGLIRTLRHTPALLWETWKTRARKDRMFPNMSEVFRIVFSML